MIEDGGIPTKVIISQLLATIDYQNGYQITAQTQGFHSMANMHHLICIKNGCIGQYAAEI